MTSYWYFTYMIICPKSEETEYHDAVFQSRNRHFPVVDAVNAIAAQETDTAYINIQSTIQISRKDFKHIMDRANSGKGWFANVH